MSTTHLEISGMICGHCVATVTDAVTAIQGVTDVRVDLAWGTVDVISDAPIGDKQLGAAITGAGYQVVRDAS